jgi:hypothetical protein
VVGNTIYRYSENSLLGFVLLFAGTPVYWFWSWRARSRSANS